MKKRLALITGLAAVFILSGCSTGKICCSCDLKEGSRETMIHVVATIKVKPGQRAELIKHFKANVPNVLAEDGCIEYSLTVDTESGIGIQLEDENTVTVVEKWESVDALQAHLAAPHMKKYKEDTKDLTEGLELKVLKDA